MATIEEGYLSRNGSHGEQTERELKVYALDAIDDNDADSAFDTWLISNRTFYNLPYLSATRNQLTANAFEYTVRYGRPQNQVEKSDPTTDDYKVTLAFNTVGGTVHITNALDTTSYTSSGAVPVIDVKKTIGIDVESGQVRGVDIFAPVIDFAIATQFDNSVVTESYVDDLESLVGTVNDDTWYGKPAGEVIFKGARGTKRGEEKWEIQFEFARSRNKTGLTIGGISGINKKGWEYLEIMYEEGSDEINGKPIKVPRQVNVHKVYEDGDFADLKIGTAWPS